MSQPLSRRSGRAPDLAPLFSGAASEPMLAMLLASGGDERIALDGEGRNRYAAPARPPQDEIWFASSTATAISPRGWAAANAALPLAFRADESEDWVSTLRRRLLNLLAPPGAEAIFCPSGTQAEYAALALAGGLAAPGQKIVNILIGPDETGRGAPLAASAKSFLNSAPFGGGPLGPYRAGLTLDGWEGAVALATLPLRDAEGLALAVADIDARAEALVRVARARGAHVLLHLLDCSKTGLSAVSRACAARLIRDYPVDVTVVVDACQLRGAPQKVRSDLEAGFLVMASGSKFAGGPAFSGALLAPPQIVARLRERKKIPWPDGLADHFALFDWPPSLRDLIAGPFGARCNTGLALRWEAALAEYEAYCALDPLLIESAVACFNGEARRQISAMPELEIDESGGDPTLLPIVLRGADPGAAAYPKSAAANPKSAAAYPRSAAADPKSDADAMLRALRNKGLYLGQSVALGPRQALRLCLSAPQIVDFAWRYRDVSSEAFAFAPLRADMEKLFDGWSELMERRKN